MSVCRLLFRSAIGQSSQDFSVICGLRTRKEQEALVAKGASKTMNSKHLAGNAVDLMAWIDGGGRWELKFLYDEIADAMKAAAIECGVAVKWGSGMVCWRYTVLGWHNGRSYECVHRFKTLSGDVGRL